MALNLAASLPAASLCSSTRLQARSCTSVGSFSNGFSSCRFQPMAAAKMCEETVIRRSANYQPSIWGFGYVQSLRSRYVGESYTKQIINLKEDVRLMLDNEMDMDALQQLQLVDNLERLGVSYHLEEEIERVLNRIYNRNCCKLGDDRQKQESLYAVALEFRLLRQHGYDIPAAETFSSFMDEEGHFRSCLSDDRQGILSLYEAAYLLAEGESDILHEATNFTTKYLKEYVKNNNDGYLSTLVNHALELPLHWRMLRSEARWFIHVYETAPNTNSVLLQLAKLDFNVVQAAHQEDLKYVSRWWKKTGLGETLDFARDRIMENFFWTVGEISEPQFGYCRRMSTKIDSLITVIDDVYDVYGTLDELELFTVAVERWDVSAIDQLPYYMKLYFHVLHNSINDMAFDALKEKGVHVIPYLKKVWVDMCKCFLLEAKWYNSRYIPTLQEYMDNAWISVSGPVVLLHAYALIANTATEEDFQILEEYPNIIRWSSMTFRLSNDLGTSSDERERGDVSTSIQCYMHETGVSEREAREHIQNLIAETWMKINKYRIEKPQWSNNFIKFAMNLARIAQCTYQNGDGHTVQDKSKDRILALLIYPIAAPPAPCMQS